MSKKLTHEFFRQFVNDNLKPISGSSNLYLVKKDIVGFKKVKTYDSYRDHEVAIFPHSKRLLTEQGVNKVLLGASATTDAIANLIIPKGSTIYLDYGYQVYNGRVKIRANKVQVHSIVRIFDKQQVLFARSSYDHLFNYENPKLTGKEFVARPRHGFSSAAGTCNSGIHFFLDLQSALNY